MQRRSSSPTLPTTFLQLKRELGCYHRAVALLNLRPQRDEQSKTTWRWHPDLGQRAAELLALARDPVALEVLPPSCSSEATHVSRW